MMAEGRRAGFQRPARAFSLVEMLAVVAILAVLIFVAVGATYKTIRSASLATSANNIRQLAAGASAYLGDNNYTFWEFYEKVPDPARRGVRWWFGFESASSLKKREGQRILDTTDGPLGGYIPGGFRPDPSFQFSGKPFKPKYQFGYIGVGYNVLLGGGWRDESTPMRYFELEKPGEIVVFATSAQVNTFQSPASPSNPMIEEFYGIDEDDLTIHGRHNGLAMVVYATGNAGFLPLDPATIDPRAPEANIGRFAPPGSTRYLK